MNTKFKAIYFALLMVTASLAGCVSQDDYDAAIEEQDTALMAVKKKEIMFYEEVVDVAMRAVADRISSPFSGSLHD